MKLCSNVCNRCRLVCKILFKSEQICGCCCKMLRGSLFWDTVYSDIPIILHSDLVYSNK